MKTNQLKSPSGNLGTSLHRTLKLGLVNFWRNKVLSIATILVIAIILFIFNIILAVNTIANVSATTLSERIDIVVYLQDDVDFYEVQNLVRTLEQTPEIKSVKYTSKEQALEIFSKTHPETADFLKKFNLKNPLPPSVSIIIKNPNDYPKIEKMLLEGKYNTLFKDYINQSGENERVILSNVAENLTNINSFIRQIIFWIVLVFVIGGALVIINAVELTIYTRRHEIYIMRLVGATPNFIRLPFIFEGILYSTIAVLLSFIFLYFLDETIEIQNFWQFYENFELGKIFLTELFITVGLGVLSSFSGVQQYIKGNMVIN